MNQSVPGFEFDNDVAFFIDCNCLATSRVGGGPTEDGANARRWHPDIQRAFYNGWKSVHGLKKIIMLEIEDGIMQ